MDEKLKRAERIEEAAKALYLSITTPGPDAAGFGLVEKLGIALGLEPQEDTETVEIAPAADGQRQFEIRKVSPLQPKEP